MIEEISEFFYSFKNRVVEADILAKEYSKKIYKFAILIKKQNLDKEYEENFLTILGYTHRLQDIKQRVFFTFQEAVYAIDLDKLMRNEESKKVNSIVYILVLEVILKEFINKEVDEELKAKALETYGKIEEKRAKENKKYHMYQS